MFRAIGRFPYGEAVLWILFVGFALSAANEYSDMNSSDAVTMAGICALAAIGVRATRVDRSGTDAK